MLIKCPLISICIPSYNFADGTCRTVESCLQQTYYNFEIIITDDSTNNEISERLSQYTDKRIKYFKNQPPLGSPENWNESIRKASGSYIKFIHHDDFFASPQSLELFVNAAVKNPEAAFFFCDSQRIDNNREPAGLHEITDDKYQLLQQKPYLLAVKNYIGPPSATMVKRDTCLYFDKRYKWIVDVQWYYRILSCFSCIYIADPLVCVSQGRPGQVTSALHEDEDYRKWEEETFLKDFLFKPIKFYEICSLTGITRKPARFLQLVLRLIFKR